MLKVLLCYCCCHASALLQPTLVVLQRLLQGCCPSFAADQLLRAEGVHAASPVSPSSPAQNGAVSSADAASRPSLAIWQPDGSTYTGKVSS